MRHCSEVVVVVGRKRAALLTAGLSLVSAHVKTGSVFFRKGGTVSAATISISLPNHNIHRPRPAPSSPSSPPRTAHSPPVVPRAVNIMPEVAPRASSSRQASRLRPPSQPKARGSIIDLSRDDSSPPRKLVRIDDRRSVPRTANRAKTRPVTRAAEVIELSDSDGGECTDVEVPRKRKLPAVVKPESTTRMPVPVCRVADAYTSVFDPMSLSGDASAAGNGPTVAGRDGSQATTVARGEVRSESTRVLRVKRAADRPTRSCNSHTIRQQNATRCDGPIFPLVCHLLTRRTRRNCSGPSRSM